MRRRRKKREALGVSLFPFLAVLICTLGVLIVLLVLAVKSADVSAHAEKTAQTEVQQSEIDQLTALHDARLVQIEGLQIVRPDAVKRMAAARTHRGHLAQEIRQLKRSARELGRQLLALDEEVEAKFQLSATDEELDQSIADLEFQIADAKKQLAEKRVQTTQAGPTTYTIVPHAGGGGTFRRPIYVECTADEIVIQPLGVRLKKSEFMPPIQNGNMLDSALLAIREYWDRYDLNGKEGKPYPLLVVRPDAAETYVLARRAMQNWDDEFGYELVESETVLEFGERDQQLVDTVEEAVAEARLRQRRMEIAQRQVVQQAMAFAESSGESNRVPGLSASSPMGGFVSNTDWKTGSHQLAEQVAQTGGQEPGKSEAVESQKSENNDFAPGTATKGPTAAQNASGQTGTNSQNPDQMSLANERGENWALPSQTPGATGYVRPIRVVISSEALEIRTALGAKKRLSTSGDVKNAVDPMVDEIWKQIESWGVSGAGSYWKPELRISVMPGGELNYEKLNALLYRSGLIVEATQ